MIDAQQQEIVHETEKFLRRPNAVIVGVAFGLLQLFLLGAYGLFSYSGQADAADGIQSISNSVVFIVIFIFSVLITTILLVEICAGRIVARWVFSIYALIVVCNFVRFAYMTLDHWTYYSPFYRAHVSGQIGISAMRAGSLLLSVYALFFRSSNRWFKAHSA